MCHDTCLHFIKDIIQLSMTSFSQLHTAPCKAEYRASAISFCSWTCRANEDCPLPDEYCSFSSVRDLALPSEDVWTSGGSPLLAFVALRLVLDLTSADLAPVSCPLNAECRSLVKTPLCHCFSASGWFNTFSSRISLLVSRDMKRSPRSYPNSVACHARLSSNSPSYNWLNSFVAQP